MLTQFIDVTSKKLQLKFYVVELLTEQSGPTADHKILIFPLYFCPFSTFFLFTWVLQYSQEIYQRRK